MMSSSSSVTQSYDVSSERRVTRRRGFLSSCLLVLLCPLLLLQTVSAEVDIITWKTKEDILQALQGVECLDYVKYRGPILQTTWLPHHGHSSSTSHLLHIPDDAVITHIDTHMMNHSMHHHRSSHTNPSSPSHAAAQHQFHHDRKVCHKLFAELLHVKYGDYPPVSKPPDDKDFYTLGGEAKWLEKYEHGPKLASRSFAWTDEVWNAAKDSWKTCGHFQDQNCSQIFPAIKAKRYFKDANVLTYGLDPSSAWAERMSVDFGAELVIGMYHDTISNNITSAASSKVNLQLASAIAKDYLTSKFTHIDVVISYGSISHEGLGKIGEEHNPWSDLESVGRFRCLLKPQGILILGIPISSEHDIVFYNAKRIYGKVRLAIIKAGWDLEDYFPPSSDCIPSKKGDKVCHAVFVLRKP